MFIHAYLRASTDDQEANRASAALKAFVQEKGHRIASWYLENESGATLNRPELMRLIAQAEKGDAILVEQVDRLSRLNDDDWQRLKSMIKEKELRIISLDLPTSHLVLSPSATDGFTSTMFKAINELMLDMLAAIARKDYDDRRRRQSEGIAKAKENGKYKGRRANEERHAHIMRLRADKYSLQEIADITGVSRRTVSRVIAASQTIFTL
ncbi:recombinase family protein [Vibrio astriarenae]